MQGTELELPHRRRLTVEDYRRMGQIGIFHDDERIELIEGEIIDMAPIGRLHAGTVNHLAWLLQRAAGEQAIVQVQSPIQLGRYSAPHPDLALLAPRADFYKRALPGPGDTLLIIEVAESSLCYDLDVKAELYAQHRVPEYWLVDVGGKRLTRYLDPREGRYVRVDNPDLAIPVEIASLAGVRLQLGDVFID